MRKTLFFCLLLAFSSLFLPTARAADVAASSAAPVVLTPQQARDALNVLNDPKRREQMEDTLRAVAAAGALATPAAPASGASAATAEPASGASGVLAKSLTSNGLASQISHQAGNWAVQFGAGLRHSMVVLLDYGSVAGWWRQRTATPEGRALIEHVAWAVLISLLPALLLDFLVAWLLRRPGAKIAARGIADAEDVKPELVREERAAERAEAVAERTGSDAAVHAAEKKTDTARGRRHAARHWTLLQRLPTALLHGLLSVVPLAVFVAAATILMSMFIDDNTPEARRPVR